MRILIVDDHEELAKLTAELLRWIDQPARYIEKISLAGDRDTAVRLLPQHDAVLCDGRFPIFPGSPCNVEEWHEVYREADRWGVHFILYSACPGALDDARARDVPAILKPAPIEEIYAALTEHFFAEPPATLTNEPGH
jgi:CheY-like chemotaxis protein